MRLVRGGRSVLAAVLGGVLLLGGCGIPDNTEVVRVGEPDAQAGNTAGADNAPEQSTREDAVDVKELVSYYLEAAAAADFPTALKQVQGFLSPSLNTNFKVPNNIKVIDLDDSPEVTPGSDDVAIRAKTIGILNQNGILEPSAESGTQTYNLTVSEITGKDGLFVTKAPQALMLTTEALSEFYDQRTIYFWNRDHTALVPDVRYVSRFVSPLQEPQEVIKWLIDGPSGWLGDSVVPLPDGAALVGNVPAVSDGRLQIRLNGQSIQPADDAEALDRLRRQLMWSLHDLLPQVLSLQVGNLEQTDYRITEYQNDNASYRLAGTPERFAVYQGQIRRMAGSPGVGDPIPVIRPEANRDVQSAALARAVSNRRYAALVTSANGRTVLRVGGVAMGEQTDLREVALPDGEVGTPVWALTTDDDQTGALGLIIVGGKLHSFSASGGALRPVAWPGPPGTMTSVAVAPDGRRVALVVGGRLYVAAMTADGEGPELTTPRRTEIADLRTVTAVDWFTETAVVVAGTRSDKDRVALMTSEIDGTSHLEVLPDMGTAPVTYLTSFPVSAVSSAVLPEATQYMANGAAFDVLSRSERIGVDDLAEPVADPPAGAEPVFPFFLR